MMGELIGWGVLFLLWMAAFRHWLHNPPPPDYRVTWNSEYERVQEAAAFAEYHKRRPHLRMVSGGEHGNDRGSA